jgi:putative phage-type endonuclease
MSIDIDDLPDIIVGDMAESLTAAAQPDTEDRRTYIGGSDAAAAIGMSPWKDRLTLYEEKAGLVTPEDISGKDAVYWGTVLEAVVAAEYVRRTGNKVRRAPKLIRHPEHPFMGAHLDRLVEGTRGLLEVKTTGAFGEDWGEEGTDQIPSHYYVQVQHYMAVTGREWADVAVLGGGRSFRLYRVLADGDFIPDLITLEAEFWACVEARTPPAPDSSDSANRRWPFSQAVEIQADPTVALAAHQLREVKDRITAAEEEKDSLELMLKKALGDAGDTLMAGKEKLCTWKTQSSRRFDSKAFEAAQPEMYETYKREITSRVFRLSVK